ncbi:MULTISPECIES: hypothetical protein [Enorma]|uniref:hypothetical protein n=1 Tax=Enorma TaxID=1472762 RepID=UPI0003467ECA|nr:MULTISPECIES: hypothetical protein [Enorma]
MRTFLILMRVQMHALIRSLTPGSRRIGMALAVVAGVLLVAFAALYLAVLGLTLVSFGLGSALPAFAVALSALVGVVFTFLKANGTLFGLTDFDLVMSLPVPRRTVVAARVAALYTSAMFMGAVASVPVWAVYLACVACSPWAVACAALSVLLAPAVPTAIATFLAFGVNALASRFRHANLVYIVISLIAFTALVVVLYGFSFTAGADGDAAMEQLAGGLAAMSSLLSLGWPPAAWMGDAVANGSVAALAAFIGVSLAVPALALEIMQRNYLRINAALTAHARCRALTAGELRHRSGRTASPFKAIALKEFRTLLGIPSYAFNCLFGYLFMLVIAVALSVVGLEGMLGSGVIDGVELSAAEYRAISGVVANALPWAFVFCGIMCPSAACSVSIEGKNAWVLAAAPLPVRTILGAKLASNALPVAATLAVSALVLLVSGQVDALGAAEVLVTGFGAFFLMVNIGLSSDARKPNFSWMSPNEVVKRGFPIMIVILGGMVLAFGGGAVSFVLSLNLGVTAGVLWNLGIGALGMLGGWLVFRFTCRTARLA